MLLVAILAAFPATAATMDRIAAIVDDEVIALSEVYEIGDEYIAGRCPGSDPTCVAEMELEVLDALIRRSLVRVELQRLEMRVTGQEIDQAIDRFARENNFEDRLALRKALEEEGTRWDAFREEMGERIRTQRFQQRVLLPRVTVTDDEVRDLYQKSARKTVSEEALLSAIGVAIPPDTSDELLAEMEAQTAALVDAINAGQIPWDEAVEKYDGAGLSSAVGGKRYRKGELAGTLDEIVFAAEVGVVQAPIRAGNVFFILRVDERAMGDSRVADYEEVEPQLRDQIFQDKIVAAEDEWYQMARRQVSVEVMLAP